MKLDCDVVIGVYKNQPGAVENGLKGTSKEMGGNAVSWGNNEDTTSSQRQMPR